MRDPYQVVRDFESALCEYTGAPYCVTVTSCTMAILLAVRWNYLYGPRGSGHPNKPRVEIPRFTYIGVAMSIVNGGGVVKFRDEDWHGEYQLKPLKIWDSARWLTSDLWKCQEAPSSSMMFRGGMVCLSFHPTKHLGISTHGGAILHDDPEADVWLRKARFDGRTEGVDPKDDKFDVLGFHCYMNPVTAAEGLEKLSRLPKHNDPLTNSDYPDLSKLDIFK